MIQQITVGVATHEERGLWLRDMINSLFHFNPDLDIKLIVVDNASCDYTREYVASLSKLKAGIRLIENLVNVDDTKAMNQILPLVETDYFLKVDSDTLFTDFNQITAAMKQALRTDSTVVGPFWDLSLRRRKESASWQGYDQFNKMLLSASIALEKVNPAFEVTMRLPRGNFMLLHTGRLRVIGGFDERYPHNAMEYPIIARLLEHGYRYSEFTGNGVVHKPSDELRRSTRHLIEDIRVPQEIE